MAKIALKGFCGARLWPITANNATTYTPGVMISLLGAQGLTKDVSRSEYTIYADDGVYDSGADFQYEDLELTLAELPLDIEAKIAGGTYDETDKTYTFKNTDVAPEYALGYAARRVDGEYRMFKHYSVKLLSIKIDHTTIGDNKDVQAYKLTFRATQRNADGAVRIIKDSSDKTYTWLNTVDALPAA